MGCLCPKKKSTIVNPLLNEALNQEPAPFGKSDDIEANITEKPKYIDLKQKRKFVEYLFKKEILNSFKKFLPEINNFNDEQFNELFQGNTNYQNFKTSDPKRFLSIVTKFEIHNILLEEFYGNEEYYEYAAKIWQKNLVLQSLKNKNEKERIEFFNQYNIDYEKWPFEVKAKIESIITNFSEYDLARILQNFIEENYGNIDDLITKTEDCKAMVNKNVEESHCKTILYANLETMGSKLINEQIPNFLKNLPKNYRDIEKGIDQEQIKRAIEKINKSGGLSEGKKKRLVGQVKNLYKEKQKNSEGKFDANEQLKELKELGININKGKINEVGFIEKVGYGLSNENIANEYLAFSLLNLNYSILHLNHTLEYETNKYKCNLDQFNEIRKNFIKHKNEVKLITDNIEESAMMMKELRKKFEEDRIKVNELINNIKDAVNGIENEQTKNIIRLLGSIGGTVFGFLATIITKGDNKGEYLSGAGSNFLSLIATSKDVHETRKLINQYNETLNEARALQDDINSEIRDLEEKFVELKNKHCPKIAK